MSDPLSYVDPKFQMVEAARGARNGPAWPSSSRQPSDTGDRDPAIAFDYLLREPRHARRLRHSLQILVGIVALSAIACVLYGCA